MKRIFNYRITTLLIFILIAFFGITASYAYWTQQNEISSEISMASFGVKYVRVANYDDETIDISTSSWQTINENFSIEIEDGYPGVTYTFEFYIKNMGKVPVHFTEWIISSSNLPPLTDINIDPIDYPSTGTELHKHDIWYGNITIKLQKDAVPEEVYSIVIHNTAYQYNEDDTADIDGDGFTLVEGDCDDTNASIYPGAYEECDGKDNDCDGEIDEGCIVDNDGDGYYSDVDCDDSNADIHPGATEDCNGLDDDCDDQVDEGTPCDDGNECTEDTCNGLEGCIYIFLTGPTCDDGDPNTINDTCVNGDCIGTPI